MEGRFGGGRGEKRAGGRKRAQVLISMASICQAAEAKEKGAQERKNRPLK